MILNQVNMPQLLNLQVVLRDRLHPFSPSTKFWARIVRWVPLDYIHASILLKGPRWHSAPQFAMSIFYTNKIRELAQ
jgi:hypothetical protein